MKFLTFIILLFSSISAFAINGGSFVQNKEAILSHTVAIRHTQGGLCSGTIIAPNTILTAAHCTQI